MIEKSVRAVLRASPAVSAIVGTRIWPLILPQSPALPAITYQRISLVSPVTLDSAIGPERIRLQVDCWALTWDAVRDLAHAVKATLHGFSGIVAGQQPLNGVFLDSEADLFEPSVGQAGQGIYRVTADYFVHVPMEAAA
ncbi:MAG: hypothetical protein A2V88_15970 [Elusimicrobia bacterium RBG_16_66_12]|nr:MAG: hypothetical protein A2V88_15970 [Elusimicrobia bacterium RBG_16_66_12]